MQKNGMTLIEVLLVISVTGILIVALDISYEDWMKRYEVEKITKELYHDLMYARMMAVEKNVKYLTTLSPHQYTMSEDLNGNELIDPGEELPAYPRTVRYELNWNSDKPIVCDTRGLLKPNGTIRVISGTSADFDCMKVWKTRVIAGKYDNDKKECIGR